MKEIINRVIEIARGEVGYCEKWSNAYLDDPTYNAGSNNYTKYTRDLAEAGFFNGSKQGYEWCTSFVTWCFYKAIGDRVKTEEVLCQIGRYAASCTYASNYYRQCGRLFNYPEVGDQAFMKSHEHTGLVVDVRGNKVYIVEGNSHQMVEANTYDVNDPHMTFYGRPKWELIENIVAPRPVTPAKSIDEVAKEVLAGKWGNNPERSEKLKANGYDPDEVQAKVNELWAKRKQNIDKVAHEVLEGKWGNGADRKAKLEAEGYDPDEVQDRVNAIYHDQVVTRVAKEVINGEWGNGQARKDALRRKGYDPDEIQKRVNELC